MEKITVMISLNSVETIKAFVNKVSGFDSDVDVESADRRYVVDAKSIMGIFSLDLSKPVKVVFHNIEIDEYQSFMQFCLENGCLDPSEIKDADSYFAKIKNIEANSDN